MIVLDEPGQVLEGLTFSEGLEIRAHNVELIDCKIDGGWKSDMYGIKVAADREGVPYRGTKIHGCDVSRFWKKGILAGWTWIKDTRIHDIGSDGVFLQPWGRVLIEGCKIDRLGWDPYGRIYVDETGRKRFMDRDGRDIHGDGIQAMGGIHVHVRKTEILLNQDDPDEPLRVGNACFYGEADNYPLRNVRLLQCRFRGANHLVRLRDEPSGKPEWQDETFVTDVKIQGCTFESPWSAAEIYETREQPTLRGNDYTHAARRKP